MTSLPKPSISTVPAAQPKLGFRSKEQTLPQTLSLPLETPRNPPSISISAKPRDKPIDCYQILKYPLRTESAVKMVVEQNTLVFVVDVRAGKTDIKEAVEKLCGIRTKKVNTLRRPDGTKKAYIMLTPEYEAKNCVLGKWIGWRV